MSPSGSTCLFRLALRIVFRHNTQHSQQTNIHAPGGIRTHDLSRRAAEDLRLRPRGHWDRFSSEMPLIFSSSTHYDSCWNSRFNVQCWICLCCAVLKHLSSRIISSTNFNAQFNNNMYVRLPSSTCFEPWHAHPQEEQLHKPSIWYPRSGIKWAILY